MRQTSPPKSCSMVVYEYQIHEVAYKLQHLQYSFEKCEEYIPAWTEEPDLFRKKKSSLVRNLYLQMTSVRDFLLLATCRLKDAAQACCFTEKIMLKKSICWAAKSLSTND